ncbi:Vesicle transport protein SEC20 [Acropora cervicornis]|uniref:Vesicle transport protein SEC20 n=1 Tax=Acropora cervicornis TaxID=6130 RepID=A0AAD9R372_ACRCE|nr:Vesicle transport protein SEC20 [Acropora cervicornis]
MADNSGIPVQARINIQEIVKIEFEVQNLVQDMKQCEGPQFVLNGLDLKVKQKMNSLKKKVEAKVGDVSNRSSRRSSSDVASPLTVYRCQSGKLIWHPKQLLTKMKRKNYWEENHQLLDKASNITQDLMSIARMMESQVKQSEEDMQMLASSSAQIKDTQEEFRGLTGIIQTSKNLLNKYNRREVTDRLLIFFGLVLFFSTVLYILKKRLPVFG